jgi:hypothetical protein
MSVETGYYEPADGLSTKDEERISELVRQLLVAVELTAGAIIDEVLDGEEEEADTDSIKGAATEDAANLLRSFIRNYID